MSRNFQEHPDESVVIRFLDGELSEREASELRRHLDGCWKCRRDLGEWQGTIDAYLRLRDTVLAAADPPPPNPWVPFEQLYPETEGAARTNWWSFWKLATVAATVLAAVFGATILLRGPGRERAAEAPAPKATAPAAGRGGDATERRAAPPPPARAGTEPRPEAKGVGQVPEADPAEAKHRQVMASKVLHELKADLTEPVEVVATATGAVVRASGLDERRRREIEEALQKLPGVEFTVRTGEGAASGRATAREAQEGRQAPRPKLYEEKLLRQLGSRAAVEEFANSVLDDSDAVTVRAHAIERLERLYPGRAGLTAADGRVVDGIIAAHRAVLRRHAAALRARLQPLLPERAAGGGEGPGALTARAIELDRLVNVAFAGARLPISDDELAARIQILLKELEP